MKRKPLLGISSCLLGNNVRYNGGHQMNHYLKDLLGQYVDFVPVCPEVECGLPTPRESMRLVDVDGAFRLMTGTTEQDITPQMESWMTPKLAELSKLPLCGFIFKAKSPSSGLYKVKVYKGKGCELKGQGIFAKGFTDTFPLLPVEEDGRMNDRPLRENFIARIFTMQRWHELLEENKTVHALVAFHSRHKYQMMSHDPKALKELGQLVGNPKALPLDTLFEKYFEIFVEALGKMATVQKNTNVLQHIMGYFKKNLDADEKAELVEVIENYHKELVPLIVPITLLNHYVRKYKPPYLEAQYYLNPHPTELMLRNHC